MVDPKTIEDLCMKWVEDEARFRKRAFDCMVMNLQSSQAHWLARADQSATDRRELQEAAGLVVKSGNL